MYNNCYNVISTRKYTTVQPKPEVGMFYRKRVNCVGMKKKTLFYFQILC